MRGAIAFLLVKCRHLICLSFLCLATFSPTAVFAQGFGAALAAYLDGDTDEALSQMHVLADDGDVDALLFLAEDAQRRFGLGDMTERATQYYTRAAQQGSSHAQRRLGDIYDQRAKDARDDVERQSFFQLAREWYRQASDQGNAQAALALARLVRIGLGGPADLAGALELYTLAAEAGQPGADRELGLLLLQQNRFDEAIVWILGAAEGGDPDAQAVLSELFLLGIAVEQSDASSLHWLEQAAAAGHNSAQRDLAVRYWSGVGVPQDRDRAFSLLQAAAEGGNVLAQIDLGWMHYRGLGIPLDYGLARQYFTAAAEAGSSEGQFRLAQMIQLAQGGDDLGPSENHRQAMELYLTAARQGYLPAQLELARQFETGFVNFRNEEQALFWYRAAAAQGDADASQAAARMLAEGRGVARFDDGPVSHFGHLPQVLFVSGSFNAGDGARISAAINRFSPQLIVLHSQGGIVSEAIEVADLIHQRGLATYIPAGAECVSACVYVFSAGRQRIVRGELGVHQLQAAQANAVVPIGDFQAVISQILAAMNRYAVPSFLIERILGSTDMYFLTWNERNQLSRGSLDDFDWIDAELISSVLDYQFAENTVGASEAGTDHASSLGAQDHTVSSYQRQYFLNGSEQAVSDAVPPIVQARAEPEGWEESVTSHDCDPNAAQLRRLFLLNSTRDDYESFADSYPECHSLVAFAQAALRMLRQGDGAQEGQDTAIIGTEEAESFLQLGRERRIEIQEELLNLGFDPGSADGIFGAATRRAIAEFTEYSTGIGSEYLSLSTWSHLRLMNRVVPDDGVWQVAISRESARNPSEDRLIATVRIYVEDGQIIDHQVVNGYDTRVVVNNVEITDQGRLNIVFDGFYLVGIPARSQRIVASVPFPERQLFGLISEQQIGSFDPTFSAVMSLRRERL
jgi:TPR repeat protein